MGNFKKIGGATAAPPEFGEVLTMHGCVCGLVLDRKLIAV